MKNNIRTAITWFLTGALTFSSVPVDALATALNGPTDGDSSSSLVLDSEYLTEEDAGLLASSDSTETVAGDAGTPSSEGETAARDWSSEKDRLLLTLREVLGESDSGTDDEAVQSEPGDEEPTRSEAEPTSSAGASSEGTVPDSVEEPDSSLTLSMALSFPTVVEDDPVSAGDTVTFALPADVLVADNTEQAVDVFAFVASEGAAPDGLVAYLTGVKNPEAEVEGETLASKDEELGVKIAEYVISDGVVTVTFTEGIESDEVRGRLAEVFGKIEIPFAWAEGVQTEEQQDYTWTLQTYSDESTNEATLVIPALAVQAESSENEIVESESDSEAITDEEDPEETVALLSTRATSPIVSKSNYNLSAERDIFWIDNNDGDDIRPELQSSGKLTDEQLDKLLFSVTFTYKDGDEEKTITLDNLVWSDISTSSSSVTMANLGGTGHWALTASGLPADGNVTMTLDDGTNLNNQKGTFSNWTINQNPENEPFATTKEHYIPLIVTKDEDGNYQDQNGRPRPSAASLGEGWYYVQSVDYVANILVRRGTSAFGKSDDEYTYGVERAILEAYSFYYQTNVTADDGSYVNSGHVQLLQAIQDNASFVKFDFTNAGDAGALPEGTVTLSNLEKYNLDGSEIVYYIDQNNGGNQSKVITEVLASDKTTNQLKDGDYLAETIENDHSENFGTNVTEVYNNGKLILTLTGYTDYTATKEWHDDDDSSTRPQVDFYLWRFTEKPDTDPKTAYQTAAPVKATDGGHNGQNAQFTIQANSQDESQTIDFSDNFASEQDQGLFGFLFGTADENYLPKYDPEGYTYVYFSREYMSGAGAGKYRTEYGKLNTETMTFDDTLIYDGGRQTHDNSIYDTGTVSNVLNGTTQASVKKTWIADAFQSELTDVVVELTLQSSTDGNTWNNATDDEGKNVTYRMGDKTPFIAEFLTQEYTASLPKYDNAGKQLHYRWIETGVYQGKDSTTNLLETPDTSSPAYKKFTLTQKGQQVEYTSTSKITEDNGNFLTSIENRIQGETKYAVQKEWGEGVDSKPIDLILYRTNSVNKQQKITKEDGNAFTLDGNIDSAPTDLYVGVENGQGGKKIGTAQETKAWYAEFTVELYDTDGSMFDYAVLEGSNGNWVPQYSYAYDDEADMPVTTIKNIIPPGEGGQIYVRKRWLDDGDEQHRGTVTMTVYEVQHANASDTDFGIIYDENAWTGNLKKITDVTLNRSNDWWSQVFFESDVNLDNILVLETSVASTDEGGTAVNPSEGMTGDEIKAVFEMQHSKNKSETEFGDQSPYETYETAHHKYEAIYHMVDLEGTQFYTVTNRRLGNIDITVTKNWADGSTDGTNLSDQRNELIKQLQVNGYELVLQLVPSDVVSDEKPAKIDYDNNTVTAGRDAVQIVGQDYTTSAKAIQTIKIDSNTSTYYFYNLPKYDLNGKVLHYTVKEMAQKVDATGAEGIVPIETALGEEFMKTCDYSFSIRQDGYTVADSGNATLRNDAQTFVATNSLTGTKDVFFWKEWIDEYRDKLGERPDIYLTLYRKNADGTLTNTYLDRKWVFTDNKDIAYCNFENMRKYDDDGNEIIYYASETMHIDATAFDYIPVYYKYSEDLEFDGSIGSIDEDAAITTIEGLDKMGDAVDGYVDQNQSNRGLLAKNTDGTYLLKEYGVFVNQIEANVTVSGKKIWANVPSGFLEADLVPVTFNLYQFAADATLPGDNVPQTNENGVWELSGVERIAWIDIEDWSEQNYNNQYNFAIQYKGENTNTVDSANGKITVGSFNGTPLPKYDENGDLYQYVLRETGDFSGSDIVGTDDEADTSLVFKQPVINNFAITNQYNSVLGKISVKKILDMDSAAADSTKPSVSFTLTRSYKGKTSAMVEDQSFSQTKVMSYKDFSSGEQTITFDNLEIYAPNGNKYVYAVEENSDDSQLIQGGFTVYGEKGWKDSVNTKLAKPYKVDGLYPTQDKNPSLTASSNSCATFKNEYKSVLVPLYFGKNWTDDSNLAGVRPQELHFNLSRKANAQPGQGNSISDENIGEIELTLPDNWTTAKSVDLTLDNGFTWENKGDNGSLANKITKVTISARDSKPLSTSAQWLITVESVEDFAPNGMPWTYMVQETPDTLPWYYGLTGKITLSYVAPSGSELLGHFGDNTDPTTITNSITTDTQIWKNWRTAPGDDTSFVNPTGYAMTLTADLYVGALEVKGTASLQSLTDESFNKKSVTWKKVDGSEFEQAISQYQQKFTASISYGTDTTLGADQGAVSGSLRNLPKVVKVNDTVYALKYYLIESSIELKDGSQGIYKEEFTPTFKWYGSNSDPNTGSAPEGYKAQSMMPLSGWGFWLSAEAFVWDGAQYLSVENDEDALIFKPLVDSEATLNRIHKEGIQAVTGTLDETNMPAHYPFVNLDSDSKRESTAINLIDVTSLSATKTWVGDSENAYGTRSDNSTATRPPATWTLEFAVMRKDDLDSSSSWADSGKRLTVSARNSEDTDSATIDHLPTVMVAKDGDTGRYKVVRYQYKALELDDKVIVQDDENGRKYRESYTVAYTNAGDEDSGYTTSATNTMETIKLHAQKNWEQGSPKVPVTFELQYLGVDGKTLKSFNPKAEVELDGEVDTEAAYYENDSWTAIWQGVPKVMNDSAKDDSGQTKYRVIEVTDTAYGTGNGLTGSGTKDDPYVLAGTGADASNPFTITNELTELKVKKEVQKYHDSASLMTDTSFSITVSGDMSGCTVYTKIGSGIATKATVTNDTITFGLKDGEEATIYGLKKGVTYTVTETGAEGYTASYTVTGDGVTTPSKPNEVKIPNTKPDESTDVPTVTVTNIKKGKLTIVKNGESDKPLAGVTFQLKVEDSSSTEDWEEVGSAQTTNANGEVEFTDLELGKTYRIVEKSVPAGYNKLAKPIEVTLPFETTTDSTHDGNTPFYTVADGSGTKYYYTDVTMTIGNNTSLTMPTTAGRGFFWPGMLGLAIVTVGCVVYFLSGKSKRKEA